MISQSACSMASRIWLPEASPFEPEHCSGSNGLASGNHILEAIEHALCEIIERDTHAIYTARGSSASSKAKVDLGTVDDPSLVALLAACEKAEVDVAAFE